MSVNVADQVRTILANRTELSSTGVRLSGAASSAFPDGNLWVEEYSVKPKITQKYVHGGTESYRNLLWKGASWTVRGPVQTAGTLPITGGVYFDTLTIVHDGLTFHLYKALVTGAAVTTERRGDGPVDIATITGFAEAIFE